MTGFTEAGRESEECLAKCIPSIKPLQSIRRRAGEEHLRGDAGAARLSAVRRTLGVRAGSRQHDPGRICAAAPLSRRARRQRARSQDRQLSAPRAGRPWRLAAGAGRRVRHERQREILFRAEDDRRFRRCAAYGAGARGDPFARRRRQQQRFHPLHAGDVRGADLAQRAGAAGRDHAAADVVAVPSQQDLVLGAHHDRAADGAGRAEAAARRIRKASASTNCSCRTRSRSA